MVARRGARPARDLRSGWEVAVVAAIAGFAAGAGLAVMFNWVHSNWQQIPGVTPLASSTVPYWLVQFLGPVLVSVCWTALILHLRSARNWKLRSGLVLVLQVAILAAGLVPIAIGGNGGVGISTFAQPMLLLVALASPVVAAVWPTGSRLGSDVWWHVLAGAAFPAALWFGQSLWAPQSLLL